MNKYHAKKVETPDGVCASMREYQRWRELKLLQRAGKISGLQRQVKYELVPTQRAPGQKAPQARAAAQAREPPQHRPPPAPAAPGRQMRRARP